MATAEPRNMEMGDIPMLVAHKMLDALKGQGPYKLITACSEKQLAVIIAALEQADKFSFERLPLEKAEQPGLFSIPDLTNDEREFWREGLVPLPAEICFYQFELSPASKSGLLVCDDPGKNSDNMFLVTRLDFLPNTNELWADGIWMGSPRSALVNEDSDLNIPITFNGPEQIMNLIKSKDAVWKARQYGSNFMLAIYMTLMLNSKTSEVVSDHPPIKLNKAREKRGVTPLFSHRIVRIVPERFTKERINGSGNHASPRLHWRRSHVRIMQTGKRVVVVRHLVGKAELGEVSHEYRVTA